ncbi:hypothetical protein ARMGADRAFT_1169357 [Armillaria gallica]|uniref:F-box domain-containing protein n=1 Tax=Armillaria gallica TaxID=47427 RepID=A0A2H3D501_ARMGA|nr:hypothetical protein ARMGADRAFT_1169357 [Armillaria gallica]
MHRLATSPPELLSEIFSHLQQLPLTFYYDTYYLQAGIDNRWAERNKNIRVLSQTCRALKDAFQPWVWHRIDYCFIPETAQSLWYKYVMENLRRKAEGMKSMPLEILRSVRIITIVTSKHCVDETFTAFVDSWRFCRSAQGLGHSDRDHLGDTNGDGERADLGMSEYNTHTVCWRYWGSVVGGLKSIKKSQILDGMIDWVKDLKLVDRLVKNAPSTFHTLEIRRPVNSCLGILSQNTAPTQWVQVIPKVSRLTGLRKLVLTFPKSEEEPSDVASIDAAKKVMMGLASSSGAATTLIVRRVIAPHYSHQLGEEDYVVSEEVFVF